MKTLINFLFETVYTSVRGIFDVLVTLFNKQPKPLYNASFGNEGDLGVSRWNHGFAITGNKALTRKASFTNTAVFGPTGSGKSSVVIINSAFSLCRAKSSIIFNDVSGEVYKATSGYLAKQGYKILRLNFSNASMSETFNPLLTCTTIPDIQKLSALFVKNALGESKADPFWDQAAINVISLFCRYVIFHQKSQCRTMQNVLRLIETFAVDGCAIDKLFVQANDEPLLQAYKATIVMGEKALQSVLITARTALSLFSDPEVCKTTQSNSIDLRMLREEPVALYMCNPLKDLMYFKPLSAVFFQTMFNQVLSRIPEPNEQSVFFILDEAATMRFPNLSVTVSNIRKYNAGLLLCMQDEMALVAQYGQAEAHQIKTNCGTQIYMKGQPLHTCKELSQLLGRYMYVDEHGHERTRELMTPDEIRMAEEALIIIGNHPPLKCNMVPYYESIWLYSKAKVPPYAAQSREVPEPPVITMPAS